MTSTTTPTRLALPLLLAWTPALQARASDGADWPQWRGPDRTGISQEAAWSSVGGPEPLWVKTLGLGHSSFAVADGRVFTLGYDAESGLDTVFCLDADDGSEIWTYSYESEIWDLAHDGGALTTPTAVGDALYTSNREGKVFCFEAASGDVRWARDVRGEMELEPPTWGFSASPLVVDDLVILNVGRVVAFDRHWGDTAWATEKNYGIAYSTPAPFELGGEGYLASLSGDGLTVLQRHDGAEVDHFEWVKEPQIYPMTPVVIGDRIFVSAGYERGCAMLRLAGGKLEELWSSKVMRNKMSGCVLWQDHLFGFDESILKCIALDGTERWRQRGMGTGSMSIAGGRMIILDGKGQVIVAEANPEAYVELARQDVFEDGTAWSTPVLSHGRIYCRSSLGQMACLDHSGARTAPAAPAATARAEAVELPEAAAILARHVAAIGGADALDRVSAVHMSGRGESLVNTVRTGVVELDWAAERGFAWRDRAGFEIGHDTEKGWVLSPRAKPLVLAGEPFDAAREAGDLARLFDPGARYTNLRTLSATTFDNRACYAVAATTAEGHARTLYFEIDSGLHAGHQGDGIPMWTLNGYREIEGVLLPTHWAFYEPVRGEVNSATFDTVSINPTLERDPFEPPAAIKPFLRTPAELAQANERLSALHAGILGEWRADDGPADAPRTLLQVEQGFLSITRPEQDPSYLSEPDAEGRMVIIGTEYVSFTPETNEAGEVEAIQIHVGGEARGRLVRASS